MEARFEGIDHPPPDSRRLAMLRRVGPFGGDLADLIEELWRSPREPEISVPDVDERYRPEGEDNGDDDGDGGEG
jgi:hypothetical protein